MPPLYIMTLKLKSWHCNFKHTLPLTTPLEKAVTLAKTTKRRGIEISVTANVQGIYREESYCQEDQHQEGSD